MTTEFVADPGDFPRVFALTFNKGDAAALVDGYDEDALLDLGGDQRACGHDAIRAALANFLAPGLPMVATPGRVSVADNLAVVTFDWSIDGAAPDGAPVKLGGSAIDVLRRNVDGHWRQLIDRPFGVTTPAEFPRLPRSTNLIPLETQNDQDRAHHRRRDRLRP